MELELADFPVHELAFGRESHYHHGSLTLRQQELIALAMQDLRVEEARLHLASPGDPILITNIHDAVEPRIKPHGPSSVFPGTLGPALPAGQGTTHRLPGCAVIVSTDIPWQGPITLTSPSALLLSMNDPAQRSPLSKTHNLVLDLKLAPGLGELEYHHVIQQATFKVAHRIAETTLQAQPARTTRLSLAPTDPNLPKIVMIQSLANESSAPHPRVAFYGVLVRDSFPTWVHPNEMVDGAVTPGTFSMRSTIPTTWEWQNHATVTALYGRHGHGLSFAGVILKPGGDSLTEKELMADRSAKLASASGASGAIICWMGGGQRGVDPMLTVQACERLGIKTVLLAPEQGGPGGYEPPLVFTVPEADAMVSTGGSGGRLDLTGVGKIVGASEIPTNGPLKTQASSSREAMATTGLRGAVGDIDFWGLSTRVCVEF